MAKEFTLTTALEAAQARVSVSASTNPIGLSESLTRPQQPNEPRDLDAELTKQIEMLDNSLTQYEDTKGSKCRVDCGSDCGERAAANT